MNTARFWLLLPVAIWAFGVMGAVFYGMAVRYGWIEHIIGGCQ